MLQLNLTTRHKVLLLKITQTFFYKLQTETRQIRPNKLSTLPIKAPKESKHKALNLEKGNSRYLSLKDASFIQKKLGILK